MQVYLYPTPLHYRQIPEAHRQDAGATVLIGADTFLAGYARIASAFDFRSLRYVIAGAEPVKAETRRVYMEKFGLPILEGYGVTEARRCSRSIRRSSTGTARSASSCPTSSRASSRCPASRRAAGSGCAAPTS